MLNRIISKPGKTLIKGVLKVSTKTIKAIEDIINTTKYEKNLLPVFFFYFQILTFVFL